MGIFRAIAGAFRAAAAKAASRVRASREARRAARKGAEKATAAESQTILREKPKRRSVRDIRKAGLDERHMEKLFYEQTKDIWKGKPKAVRNELIMEALGVDDISEAKRIVEGKMLRDNGIELPEDWEARTDEERYKYIMSILSAR